MSSGRFEPDTISFEINHNMIQGRLSIGLLRGENLTPDRIILQMETHSYAYPDASHNTSRVIVTKENAKVLKRWFKAAAKHVEEWGL